MQLFLGPRGASGPGNPDSEVFLDALTIKDPKKLFNSSLEGNTRRAIDLREGEKINEAALKLLIRAAVAANSAARAQRAPKKK